MSKFTISFTIHQAIAARSSLLVRTENPVPLSSLASHAAGSRSHALYLLRYNSSVNSAIVQRAVFVGHTFVRLLCRFSWLALSL